MTAFCTQNHGFVIKLAAMCIILEYLIYLLIRVHRLKCQGIKNLEFATSKPVTFFKINAVAWYPGGHTEMWSFLADQLRPRSSYMSPNADGGLHAGSQPMSTAVHMEPK